MSKVVDLTGKTLGDWTVLGRGENDRHGKARWTCRCVCGVVDAVLGNNLVRGSSTGCGCTKASDASERKTTHGQSDTATYRIWGGMLARCRTDSASGYENYGGRGITVCARWLVFENFLADMGERPEGLSLDRYPNADGNYEPGNVRWATAEQQGNNRRGNHLVTIDGTTMTLTEWARLKGISYRLVKERIQAGWPDDVAILAPAGTRWATRKPVAPGHGRHLAKLSEDDVLDIRSVAAFGGAPRDIAEAYGLTPNNVRMILRGLTWTHLPGSHGAQAVQVPARDSLSPDLG